MFESGAPTDIDEPELVWRFFNERHYLLLVPNRLAHSGPGLSCAGYSEAHHYPRRTTNYFAVPCERHAEFRGRARQILKVGTAS